MSALGLLSVIVPLLEAADTGGAMRVVLALAFHVTIPGVPLLLLARLDSPVLIGCAGGALSIALTIAGAQLMLWSDAWHPLALVVVLALVSLAALAVDLWRGRRSAARPGSQRSGRDRSDSERASARRSGSRRAGSVRDGAVRDGLRGSGA
ncbi:MULTISPECIES: hypothetical protein [unclassified Frankia]|uniref:hypothetical protein n=1 Tax=unclassified Frankia TaxID=2632575 RepID=UPI0002DFC097|nr:MULTISPECIES: hypothetical protein [unclassified Frankia]